MFGQVMEFVSVKSGFHILTFRIVKNSTNMTFELMTDPCMLLYSQGIWIAGVMPQLGLDAVQWENCFFLV